MTTEYKPNSLRVTPKGKIEFLLAGPVGRQDHDFREDIRRGCFAAMQMQDGTIAAMMTRDGIKEQFFNDPRLWLNGHGPNGIVLGKRLDIPKISIDAARDVVEQHLSKES